MNASSTSTERSPPVHFIGFDLGHGESSLACLPSGDPNASPDLLRLSNDELSSWPTAYCVSTDGGGAEIGNMAIVTAARNHSNHLHMAFKARPDVNLAAADKMVQYTEIVWRRLAARHEGTVPHNVFVGCPSGWTTSSIEAYQQRLGEVMSRNTQISSIAVIRESRAAMYQAFIESQRRIMRESFFSETLVIDVGSSTIDFTAISGPIEVIDRGYDIGAGLIDEAILALLPEWESDPRIQRVIRELEGTQGALLLAMCRQAKEDYFRSIWRVDDDGHWRSPTEEDERAMGQGASDRQRFSIGDERPVAVRVELDYERMRQVMSYAIPALAGESWGTGFANMLRRVQHELADVQFHAARLVLTGGASKMPLVQRAVRQVFSDAEILPVSDSSTFIAKGLSRSCARDYRIGRFRAAIEPLTDKPLFNLVGTHFPQYKKDLGSAIATSLVDYAVVPALQDWRSGSISTLDKSEGIIKERIDSWFNSEERNRIWKEQTRKFDTKIKTDWCDLKEVGAACAEFDITYSQMRSGILELRDGLSGIAMPEALTNPAVLIPNVTSLFTLIVATVVAVLMPIIITLGPVAWVIAIVLAAYGAEQILREYGLPQQVREPMLSDERIATLRTGLIEKLSAELEGHFGSDFNELQIDIGKQIRAEVKEQVDKELRLIR